MIVSKNKMSTRQKSAHLSCLVLFILAMCSVSLSHAKVLKVCYDQWPPMTIFPTKQAPARGVVIEMLESIYASSGYTVEYYEVPLARGLDMVAEGLCDMLPEYLFSKHAEKGFVYGGEETFAYSSAFVVRRNDSWRYNGVQSIKNKRVATGPGWDYSSMSADYQNYLDDPKNSKFVEVIAGSDDIIDRIFRMIIDDRVDLYVDNDLVLQYVLNQLGLNEELEIVRPGLEKKLHERPIFSSRIPKSIRQNLIKIWDEGRLSFKGEKERVLLKKYNVTFE